MKYRIKNPALEKLIFTIFDEESVMNAIAEQMPNTMLGISLASSTLTNEGTTLNKEFLHITGLYGILGIPKSEIEAVFECEPSQWYPYPQVMPPEPKKYLVQYAYTRTGEKILSTATWYPQGYWTYHGDEHDGDPDYNEADGWIVAFRELPGFYEPEAQE